MRREALLLALLLALSCGRVERSGHRGPEAGGAEAEATGGDPSGADRGGTAGKPAEVGGASTAPGGAGGAGGAGAVSGGVGGDESEPSCEQQRSEYAKQRDQVVAEFASFPCETAKDCLSAYDPSNCADCSFLVTTAARRGVVDRLVILGQQLCTGSCARKSSIACPDVPPPTCVMNRCVPGE